MSHFAYYDQIKYSWELEIYHDNIVFFFFPLEIRFMTALVSHEGKI